MKEIPLTQGKTALVDDNQYSHLSKYRWHYIGTGKIGYAARSFYNNKKRYQIYMHREIMNPDIGMEIDHIDHNTLDNRRCNLRICDRSQNQANRVLACINNSGAKGVGFDKSKNKWRADIGYKNKSIRLGYYDSIEDAINAYNNKAQELFGEFAYNGDN